MELTTPEKYREKGNFVYKYSTNQLNKKVFKHIYMIVI